MIRNGICSLVLCLSVMACAHARKAGREGVTDVPAAKLTVKSFRADRRAYSPAEVEKEALLLKTLKNPPVPLKAQNKVVRILFLPYVDRNGVLHDHQYAFIEVEEGKWILGDYLLTPQTSHSKLLKPLDNPAPPEASAPAKNRANVKGNRGIARDAADADASAEATNEQK